MYKVQNSTNKNDLQISTILQPPFSQGPPLYALARGIEHAMGPAASGTGRDGVRLSRACV